MILIQPNETPAAYLARLYAQLAAFEAKGGRYYGTEASRIRREIKKLSQPPQMYPSTCPPSKEAWLPEPDVCPDCGEPALHPYAYCRNHLSDRDMEDTRGDGDDGDWRYDQMREERG